MSLRCEEVRDRFSALWENELNPSDQAETRGHLDLCAECREEFARFDRTLRLLHSAEEVDVPDGFLAGVYEKMEERKRKSPAPAAEGRGWFNLPLRLKLPLQAFAMVAVVFLALYLTKMTPVELPRVNDATEPKSALIGQKKSPDEARTPVLQEKKLDQLSSRRQDNKVKEEEVSAPSNLPSAPAPPLREEYKSPPPSVGKPAKMAEEGETSPRPRTNVSEGKVDLRTGVTEPSSASGPKADESLRGSRLMAKKAEEASGAGGTLSSEIKPSQELVLKVKDQKGILPHLEELTKQAQGVIVNAARDNLLISLPKSSIPEFRNELEKIGSVKEKVPPVGAAKGTGVVPEQTSMEKGRDAKGKDKEADSSIAKEDQVLIQIDLIEE